MSWCHWCRLCGKQTNEVAVEKLADIIKIVEQAFSIEINDYNELPKNICSVCNEFITKLIQFSTQANKIQTMYMEIINNSKKEVTINLNEIRMKYNLNEIIKETKEIVQIIQLNPNLNKSITEAPEFKTFDSTGQTYQQCMTEILEQSDAFDSFSENINENQEDELSPEKKSRTKMKTHKVKVKKHNDEQKSLECKKCEKKFSRESNYNYHLRRVHNLVKKLPPCEFCGKVIKTKQKLKLHLELHLPPEQREKLLFKCVYCTSKFTQKGAMRAHIRAQHSFEKPYICEECGKDFTSQSNLWSHKRSHDDKNHLSCTLCPKAFKNKHRLMVHMKNHNNPCHSCSVCGVVLKTLTILKNHMLVHSDVKPFKCNFCGKDFKRDKSLQTHMIAHSGLTPFMCRFCNQSFSYRYNCTNHEKSSHLNEYEAALSEPQLQVVKKLPNIKELKTILEQIKSEKSIS